jgi:hypothetical protein
VVKENFSRDLAEALVDDFVKATKWLEKEHAAQQQLIQSVRPGGAASRVCQVGHMNLLL